MSMVERIVLKIKRRETPVADLAYRAYKRVRDLDLPDAEALRVLYGAAYSAYSFWEDGSEWALSKLLFAPMLRARCAAAGKGLSVTSMPYIRGHATIRIGDRCSFQKLGVDTGRFLDHPELLIGDDCHLGYQVRFILNRRIALGNHVLVAGGCTLQDSDGHRTDREARMRGEPLRPEDIGSVELEDHVWIGAGSHILKRVRIGAGAVIGAGSVVLTDIPPGAVAIGAPARVVKR